LVGGCRRATGRDPTSISAARFAGFFIGETMSKGTWAFRPTDLKRAIKAASSAGLEIASAEIELQTGKIVLMFGKSVASSPADNGGPGGWDNI
jgi:hypothetical protein